MAVISGIFSLPSAHLPSQGRISIVDEEPVTCLDLLFPHVPAVAANELGVAPVVEDRNVFVCFPRPASEL